MINPAGRVLALLERVQDRPGRTALELAGDLGVSERTVRRYVTTLQDLGIPVAADRGRRGGFRLAPGFRMAPLMLSSEEAVALTLTLAVLPDGAAPAAEAALGKLRRALPRDVAERVEHVVTALAPPSRGGTLARDAVRDPGVLLTLAGAAVGTRACRVRHRTQDGADSVRVVNPYGFAMVRGHMYLHGWCHLRRARRTFRLDRLERVEVLAATFRAPSGLDVAAAVEESLAMSWREHAVSVLVDAPCAEVRARVPRYVAIAEEVDEHTTRLRMTTRDLDATVLRLSDHPFAMRVEAPPELAEAFARLGRRLLAAVEST